MLHHGRRAALASSAAPPDAQFNYVTMLLHGDGTNGAQNNTFVDSSTNNFTITRNGNTTQGSFSPYGSNWSNYFDGSADTLKTASSSAFAMSGDFTMECWAFPLVQTQNYPLLFHFDSSSTAIQYDHADAPDKFSFVVNDVRIAPSATQSPNAWYHIAGVRSGSTCTLYINGVSVATMTNSASLATSAVYIGGNEAVSSQLAYLGYISNIRIVKGTAVYTSNFTPSTTPLTAISGTSLLTCQSNRFIDNSTNNFSLTTTGTPSVQRFNPFGASTAYSTSVIGGSGYFDGSGDYLTFSSNTPMDFGTGAFTIECWVYTGDKSISGGASRTIIGNSGNSYTMQLYIDTSVGKVVFGNTGSTNLQGTSGIANNAWHHIAVVRSGTGSNQTALFVDGAREALGTNSQNYTSGTIYLGAFGTSDGFWNGYVSNLRIVKGTAVYDPTVSTLTVPTAPLSAVTNTSLLTNFTNGAIFDNAMMNDLETVGNAQISTSVVKYGTGSLAFDGTGDYLISRNYLNSTFGTGDFTIEMWLYYSSSASGSDFVIDCRPTSVNGAYPTIYIDSGIVYYYVDTANRITSSAISTNTWMHIAICRSGTSTKMFINGTQTGSTYTDSTNYICRTDGPVIGADRNFGDSLLGYIDDLRITKGYARYTANFTPPTAAFPNTGPI